MNYSKRLGPPIVSATIAMLSMTSFAIVTLVQRNQLSARQLFDSVWPITLTSTVAVILVMSFLYRSLRELVAELERRELSAQHQAMHDPLTGLANRALLEDRIERALHRRRRLGETVALLLFDLDRFKSVNDTRGHSAGDDLLKQVSRRLDTRLRDLDTLARIGGDEFAILIGDPKNAHDVAEVCRVVQSAIQQPVDVESKRTCVTASIGAVLASDDDTASELLRKADITMYEAKRRGGNSFQLFSRDMDEAVQRQILLETKLRDALVSGHGIELEYQPILDVRNDATGLEALLRWSDDDLGNIKPEEAISVAEECGLIDDLGELIFRKACRAGREFPQLRIGVNVSPAQFGNDKLPGRLQAIASSEGVSCHQFELEITENLFVQQGNRCRNLINQLRQIGFSVALDDFGTGYSSLGYLRRFQVDAIKLDRSLTENVERDGSIAILRAAVTLGHELGLRVVAEGISTENQRETIFFAGCDEWQGYLCTMPTKLEDLKDGTIESRTTLSPFAGSRAVR